MEKTVKKLPEERFSLLVNHVVKLLGLERFFRKENKIKQIEMPEAKPAKYYSVPLATSTGPQGITTPHSMENTNRPSGYEIH